MPSSHQQASPSSRPPPAPASADAARRTTALAAGGSVLLLSVTAVVLWPRTYGTEATFAVDAGVPIANPTALSGRIEATLLEREELASAALELPAEQRSPDPIGRLRAGIRVQSRGGPRFSVEFRGSDPDSVQRITNRLVDRAVALVPRLAASPSDASPALVLAARTRAVTEFLTAHPEVTLEQAGAIKGNGGSGADSGLDALRTEKRQIEARLANGAADNPYYEPAEGPDALGRRLVELKNTIARREAALKQPKPAAPQQVPPALTAEWRTLLADLAAAQTAASEKPPPPLVTAHVTARAPRPSSPLTPNRFVLSVVAVLLSMAAAMVAYVLPRKAEPTKRRTTSTRPRVASGDPAPRSEPPAARSEPPPPAPTVKEAPSEPPPAQQPRPRSDPPGAIAVQRTVVLTGNSSHPPPRASVSPGGPTPAPAGTEQRPPAQPPATRDPVAPDAAFADTALAIPAVAPVTARTVAPRFGSRPPPGAGSYSVSSSHPPPLEPGGGKPTSVERLSPLQSQRPPQQPTPQRQPSPAPAPQIMSRPPALDPAAEAWAARFETLPPPESPPPEDTAAPKRNGRWKTQVMGSMVPLEVMAAREQEGAREPARPAGPAAEVVSPRAMPAPTVRSVVSHDVAPGWQPKLAPIATDVAGLRDAVLQRASGQALRVAVTGPRGAARAQLAAALAVALSHSGARVLLVEGDFDSPEIHRVMDITTPSAAGFSQQLMARRHDAETKPWAVVRCSATLDVLAEGRMRSPGLVGQNAFERALDDLRDGHDVTIVHAPAIDELGDLSAIGRLVQGAILVQSDHRVNVQFGDDALGRVLS